jgi:hypothetical protein
LPSTSVKSHFDDFCSFFSCFFVLTTVNAVPVGRLHFVTNAVQGDLGTSYRLTKPVT